MGAYHGRFGFDTFSHRRAVHEQSTRFDVPLLYPPYTEGKTRWLRRALKLGDPVDGLAKVKQRLLGRR
jgi:aldehyde dehydrogenase (NAD+)